VIGLAERAMRFNRKGARSVDLLSNHAWH
jgi:hypothetical protein